MHRGVGSSTKGKAVLDFNDLLASAKHDMAHSHDSLPHNYSIHDFSYISQDAVYIQFGLLDTCFLEYNFALL